MAAPPPGPRRVVPVLFGANCLFGAGAVVGSIGLPSMNPFLFALIRESSATLLLGAALLASEGVRPPPKAAAAPAPGRRWRVSSVHLYWKLGVCVFLDQGCSILGIKLSDAVTQSIWQTTQPILTAVLARVLYGESLGPRRILGVVAAFGGCAAMVSLGVRGAGGRGGPARYAAANACFFANCGASAFYVILCKGAPGHHSTLRMTLSTYARATSLTAAATGAVTLSPAVLRAVCADCGAPWRVPTKASFAIAYWVLGQSVAGYSMVTWAARNASSALVAAFAVVQPVVAAALTAVILAARAYPNCDDADRDDDACLEPTGWPALGAVLVFAGLYLVVSSEAPDPPAPAADRARDRPSLRVEIDARGAPV